MESTALNLGLDFAMEFGENWMRPIQERLSKKHPELSQPELDQHDLVCRQAMNFGHNQLVTCWREAQGRQSEAFQLFKKELQARYTWISDENLSRLFSQSCYYAYKDGEI